MEEPGAPETSQARGIPLRLVVFLVIIGVLSFGWLFLLGYVRTESEPIPPSPTLTATLDVAERVSTLESQIVTLEFELEELERGIEEAELSSP